MLRFLLLFIPILSIQTLALAQDGQLILGKWTNEDHSQIVQVVKKNNVYLGKLVSINVENAHMLLDAENEDDTKKSRRLLGAEVWTGFSYIPESNSWKYGEIYNYKTGNIYNGKITVEGNELKLTGHYGFFFFLAKTQKWTRVTE
jgi:uncharacterized protein (DUF2147 family)